MKKTAVSKIFRVGYDNDTGFDDGGFWEWWTVVDSREERTIAKCVSEADAQRIVDLLNREDQQ